MRTALTLLLLGLPAVAAPVPKALKKAPSQSIDGYWYLVESVEDGVPQSLGPNYCRYSLIRGEAKASLTGTWPTECDEKLTVIDPARPHLRNWQGRPAWFEADGDTLRVCFATDGRKELTECKPEKGVTYYVYERRKE